jgi:hypothetical protein
MDNPYMSEVPLLMSKIMKKKLIDCNWTISLLAIVRNVSIIFQYTPTCMYHWKEKDINVYKYKYW